METAQSKALAALQPFIHEANAAKQPSPRVLSDLITRATSAPGTYVFTELLQTAAVQSLLTAEPEYKAYLTILELFSWGTYEEYRNTPGLPALSPAQHQKLLQLSLLTLASPFAPVIPTSTAGTENHLAYSYLLSALFLDSSSKLESLITSSIYSGLLSGRLSPASSPPIVLITSVAPLRDLRPQSLPALLQILSTWEQRCSSVASELEAQIDAIRTTAAQRAQQAKGRQEIVDAGVKEIRNNASKAVRSRNRQGNKRDLDDTIEGEFDEEVSSDEARMDVDEDNNNDGRGGKTKGGTRDGGGVGAGSSTRGAKRNRGRASK